MSKSAAKNIYSIKRTAGIAVRLMLCALLLVPGVLSITGCKKSLILTELVRDQENGKIDPSAEPLHKEVLGAPEDKTRVSTLVSNENATKTKRVKRNYDENEENQQQTEKQKHKESNKDKQASEGDAQGDGSDKGLTGNDGTDTTGTKDKEEDKGTQSPTKGGSGGTEETYDPDGKNASLPQNVHTVAACGQYALIVQMLAGKGSLVAADSEWLTSIKKSGAFKNEGLDNVVAAWSGDGTKKGSADYEELRDLHPDCLLIESESRCGLAKAELKKLKSSGVSVVKMPKLGEVDTPDSNVTQAVEIVGELLKDAGSTIQYDAQTMAETYVSMHDEAIDNCVSSNGGYTYKIYGGASYGYIYQGTKEKGKATTKLSSTRFTTAYIDSWTKVNKSKVSSGRTFGDAKMGYLSSASEKLDCSDGIGLSATATSKNFLLIDYYLQCSGAQDNSLERVKPVMYSSSSGYSRPYAVAPGSTDSFSSLDGKVVKRTSPSAMWYSPTGDSGSNWVTVGDESYPGVIVRTKKIAKSLLTSANKIKGFYNVGQKYYVYTMPVGLAGNWADGTVESYLTAPWAFDMLRGETSLANASSYISAFYETFYRVDNASKVIENYGKSGVSRAKCPTSSSDGGE